MSAGRTLSYRHLVALSAAQAMIVISGGSSFAGGPVSNESDILGLKLTMSRDQAKKQLSDNFPGGQILDIPVQISSDTFKKSAVAGFLADLTSSADAATNKNRIDQIKSQTEQNRKYLGESPLNMPVGTAGDFGHDGLMVLANPNDNATDIFGVVRHTEYSKSNMPVANVLLNALKDKYGPPTHSTGNSFTWTAPGVIERAQKTAFKCFQDFNGNYLYETDSNSFFLGDKTNSNYSVTQNVLLNQEGSQFINFINHLPGNDRSQCGIIVNVFLNLSNDGAYVTKMTTRLIDLARANAELKAFTDNFWQNANAAKQGNIARDSLNKPKL